MFIGLVRGEKAVGGWSKRGEPSSVMLLDAGQFDRAGSLPLEAIVLCVLLVDAADSPAGRIEMECRVGAHPIDLVLGTDALALERPAAWLGPSAEY